MAISLQVASAVRVTVRGTAYLPSPAIIAEGTAQAAASAAAAAADADDAAAAAAAAAASAASLSGALAASFVTSVTEASLANEVVLTDTTTVTWDRTTANQIKANAAAPAANSITNAQLVNVATSTIKGRTTSGTGSPEDLTATQATALLNAVVGDSGSGGTKGLVPAPAAGDTAAGKYLSAAGTWAAPPSSLVLIQTQVASASAQIDFTSGLNDTYDRYIVKIDGVKAATDDVVFMLRVGTGGGPTYQTTGYAAGLTRLRGGSATPNSVIFTTSIGLTDSTATTGLGNATGEKYTGSIEFDNPESADFCEFTVDGQYGLALGDSGRVYGGGRYNTAGAITAIRFMMSSGNIASGRISLYGMKKS